MLVSFIGVFSLSLVELLQVLFSQLALLVCLQGLLALSVSRFQNSLGGPAQLVLLGILRRAIALPRGRLRSALELLQLLVEPLLLWVLHWLLEPIAAPALDPGPSHVGLVGLGLDDPDPVLAAQLFLRRSD